MPQTMRRCEQDVLSPWAKRLRTATLRGIAQNQALGARYFRLVQVDGSSAAPQPEGLDDPVTVLEEIASCGRCIVALPDEAMLALYFVDSTAGASRLLWYEPQRRLSE